MERRKSLTDTLIASPHIVWCILFIIAPLIFVAYYAFTDGDGNFSFSNFTALFEQETLVIFGRSVFLSLIATAISLIVAYPLAYALSRMKVRYQGLFIMLIMLPMWTNFLIRTYTLSQIFERNGIINTVLMKLGMEEPIGFLGTGAAVVFGMIYNYLPYMVLPIYSVLVKLDPLLIEAAQDLGCNSFRTVTRVVLPLSVSGIISGVTMVFVPSISTFYISQAMSKRTMILVGDAIERQFMSNYNYNMGAMLSCVLMVLVLISMWIMNRFGDKEGGMVA